MRFSPLCSAILCLIGDASMKVKFNDIFEVYESFFEDNATLKQRIKLNDSSITEITLNLTGQVCKEVCLQVDEDFTFYLNKEKNNTQKLKKILSLRSPIFELEIIKEHNKIKKGL